MVAERVQEQLSIPVHLDGHPVAVSASIGIVMHDGQAVDPEEFLRDADTAMYRAKQAGKMQHAVFDKAMHVAAKSRLKLENELRLGLDRNEFKLQFQPIVALDSGEITAFEALLRWTPPGGAVGPPSDFVRLAEETGLILPIGRWALTQACRTLRAWHDKHPQARSVSMNVNIARRQLLAPGFCDDLERILDETGIDAGCVNLELTESTVIEAFARLPTVLQRVKDLGFRLYMDDFGTGYSSLSCLHDFPIDVLKIDRSFVGTMGSNRDYAVIVHSIMTLARHLQMRVVAEGIESQRDLASLLALDCDFGQGFYFSRPVDERQALKLVLSGGAWRTPSPPPPEPLEAIVTL
jgi:EAL domain-containing protein (putative c-di-GMP-specific phosphodiesterase class I)